MPDKGKVKNIIELAALAGVSPGTVSRALAGSTLISKATRERIQALARKHDFRRNVMAQNLRFQRAGAIGVVIPLGHEAGQHISDPFFMTMLGFLADALTERGYDLLLSRVIPSHTSWLSNMVGSGRTDGTILIGQSNQTEVIEAVAAFYRPLVAWGAHFEGQTHCSVGSDNHAGGILATRHLIERGARRIAFLGDALAPEIADRLSGCQQAMTEAGLADNLQILPASLTADVAYPAISAWLKNMDTPPEGIFAASDVIAMCALRAISECGWSAPGDIHVVGYDDLVIASQTAPPLTTINQDLAQGAAHLVDLLFRRIAGEDTPSVIMPPKLVIRQSS